MSDLMTSRFPTMRDAGMPLPERINAAIDRIAHGNGHMRVPVEATDPDIVLGDCRVELESQAAQIAALTAERDLWVGLYRRAINEANGLTNYVEDRPELRSAEKRLSAIEAAARASLNPTNDKET